MKRTIRRTAPALAAAALITLTAIIPAGAAPNIGSINSARLYLIDGAEKAGSTTLKCGQLIESQIGVTSVVVEQKSRFDLNTKARAKFCQNTATIESGTVQFSVPRSFRIESGNFLIASLADKAAARAQIVADDRGAITLQVLSGRFQVSDGQSGLQTKVLEGETKRFLAPSAGKEPQLIVGCLQQLGTQYQLRDEYSNLSTFVQGDNLRSQLGYRVQVAGKQMVSSQGARMLKAATVTTLEKTCVCSRPIALVTGSSAIASGIGIVTAASLLGHGELASPSVK